MKRLDAILAAVGLGLFAFIAGRIGWINIVRELKTAWVALPLVVGLSLLRLFLQTKSWSVALQAEGITARFRELAGIRMASQSMGYLSVLGPALSEPMKIKLLGRNWQTSTAATIADTGVYWFASALTGIAGCVAAAMALTRANYGPTLLVTAAVFVLCLVLLLRRDALLGPCVRLCGPRVPRWLAKSAEMEGKIRAFRERHRGVVRSMMAMDLACQALLIAEAAVMICFARLPVHILPLLGIEAVIRVAKMTTGWLPARIGADEGGAAAAFAVFGLPPAAGLMLALARRCRDLLWCLAGLGWLAWRSRQSRNGNAVEQEVVPHADGYRYSM